MDTLLVEKDGPVTTLSLNRPDVHNAFNEVMMTEIKVFFENLKKDNETKVVVINGIGKSFCAGADLNYMKSAAQKNREQNIEESLLLAHMLQNINECPKPIVGMVHGACFGGGLGLVSACDVVLTHKDAVYSFSEAKLGMAPSVISPFVINKIGESRARLLFITAERFGSQLAKEIGLAHTIYDDESAEISLKGYVDELLKNGVNAMSKIKELIRNNNKLSGAELTQYTAEHISDLRASEEAQLRLTNFLNKKK